MLNLKLPAITLLSSLACLAVSAHASDVDKIMVLDKATEYAKSIACDTTFDSGSDIRTTVHHVHAIDIDDNMDKNYVVYWRGDKGCARGSGTYGSFVTLVSQPKNGKSFVVHPNSANILQSVNRTKQRINNRFVEAVQVNESVINVLSLDVDTNDCNQCPSLKYKHQLGYSEDENDWVVLSEQFIGKEK